MRQRGFTLIEVLIACAIAAALTAAAWGFTQGAQPFSATSSASLFDASFSYARAVAATSGDGATMVFAPLAAGPGAAPGFLLAVYSGRPDGLSLPVPGALPAAGLPGTVSEAGLGTPPFALFVNSAGRVSGQGGYPAFAGGVAVFSALPSEPTCPAAGALVLTFSDVQGSRTRTLRCGSSVAGPAQPYATVPP